MGPAAQTRNSRDYLAAFVELHKLASESERRALWRQSMASLATAAAELTPVPLEGLHPEMLLASVRAAIRDGFLDELDFLSTPLAAAALYELAAALPPSDEKRIIGRLVAKHLHEGDAPTFIALATSLALGSRRGLAGARVRARVALSLDLPTSAGANADALALALVSRRELVRDWLTVPSAGSLPSRRLAARLLERAAREAATRAAQGDDSATRVFLVDSVAQVWQRLLSDRDPLVWRHVAVARGLLAEAVPSFAEQIERDLRSTLSPTEWRRAAASLAARVAVEPEMSLARAKNMLAGSLMKSDPGIAAATIHGLARAAEAEPETAAILLDYALKVGGVEATEALVELQRELPIEGFGERAILFARGIVTDAIQRGSDDDGRLGLLFSLLEELTPRASHEALTLRERILRAQKVFAEVGAAEAHELAKPIVEEAERMLAELEKKRFDGRQIEDNASRIRAFRLLRELDVALLESSTLSDLLVLGQHGDEDVVGPLNALEVRLLDWLLLHEQDAVLATGPVAHLTFRLRRLRTLLHVVDADGANDEHKSGALRERRLRTTLTLLGRVKNDAPSPLRRTVCATLARVLDALVREELYELSDVFLAATSEISNVHDLTILSEASTVPDLELALRNHVTLLKRLDRSAPLASVQALLQLARDLPPASSPRVEALRTALMKLGRALETLVHARALAELPASGANEVLTPVEAGVHSFAQLVFGAKRRLGLSAPDESPRSGTMLKQLDLAVDLTLGGSREQIDEVVRDAERVLDVELPSAIAQVIAAALARIPSLPSEAPPSTSANFAQPRTAEAPLPPWLPPSRTLGGFYVLRCIGSGAGGSVFVAKRADERHDAAAESFALKVPEYNGAAARTLSEAEFLGMFREEAGALLTVPASPHLAHLVTFDGGAKPKPVLVMEFVQGPSLERLLGQRTLTTDLAFHYLDGIAAGLEAMHSVGVGHLDLKPSNIIVRGERDDSASGEAVLVDFGLAGRKLRPGCATGSYGAPEVWGLIPAGHDPKPMAADVYALACVAFELMTSQTLIEAPTEISLIALHTAHDGMPERLAALDKANPHAAGLIATLRSALRRDPRERIDIREFRDRIRANAAEVAGAAWPLQT